MKSKKNTIRAGNFGGYDYAVREIGNHYSGYIRVEEHEKHINFGEIDVHYGFTYGLDDDGWIGFDCNHSGDICFDPLEDEPLSHRNYRKQVGYNNDILIWYPENVVAECEAVIDQIGKMVSSQEYIIRVKIQELKKLHEDNVFTDDELEHSIQLLNEIESIVEDMDD